MTRLAETLSPTTIASILRDNGIGLLAVGTDRGLAEQLWKLNCAGFRASRIHDYGAIRNALRLLLAQDERAGRAVETARYRPAFMDTETP